jgi:hypothetical protein
MPWIVMCGVLAFWAPASQQTFISPSPPPVDCPSGALQYTASTKTYACGSISGGALPSGAIVLIDTGACPAGTTEISAMDGKMPLGTLNANANVGTTGGSDTVTPTGAISWPAGVPTHSGTTATFSGNALATHAHELPFQLPTATSIRQTAVATFGTGTSRAATATITTTSNTTSAAVALSQAVTAGTPAGTVNITSQGTIAWPAGVPTIAAGGENRSAFRRVIFCKAT